MALNTRFSLGLYTYNSTSNLFLGPILVKHCRYGELGKWEPSSFSKNALGTIENHGGD